jgi:hypothetical protein
MQPVTSTFTRRYNKNRAIIELRSIADHSACMTAWSQLSWSFDGPARTGDIKVPICAVARPVENQNLRRKSNNTVGNNKTGTNKYNTNYTNVHKNTTQLSTEITLIPKHRLANKLKP